VGLVALAGPGAAQPTGARWLLHASIPGVRLVGSPDGTEGPVTPAPEGPLSWIPVGPASLAPVLWAQGRVDVPWVYSTSGEITSHAPRQLAAGEEDGIVVFLADGAVHGLRATGEPVWTRTVAGARAAAAAPGVVVFADRRGRLGGLAAGDGRPLEARWCGTHAQTVAVADGWMALLGDQLRLFRLAGGEARVPARDLAASPVAVALRLAGEGTVEVLTAQDGGDTGIEAVRWVWNGSEWSRKSLGRMPGRPAVKGWWQAGAGPGLAMPVAEEPSGRQGVVWVPWSPGAEAPVRLLRWDAASEDDPPQALVSGGEVWLVGEDLAGRITAGDRLEDVTHPTGGVLTALGRPDGAPRLLVAGPYGPEVEDLAGASRFLLPLHSFSSCGFSAGDPHGRLLCAEADGRILVHDGDGWQHRGTTAPTAWHGRPLLPGRLRVAATRTGELEVETGWRRVTLGAEGVAVAEPRGPDAAARDLEATCSDLTAPAPGRACLAGGGAWSWLDLNWQAGEGPERRGFFPLPCPVPAGGMAVDGGGVVHFVCRDGRRARRLLPRRVGAAGDPGGRG